MLTAVLTHLQAWFIGLPIQVALRIDKSVNATYLGRVSLVFIFSLSTVALVVGPKIYQVWRNERPAQPAQRVRISGLGSSNNDPGSGPSSMNAGAKSPGGTFHDSVGSISAF